MGQGTEGDDRRLLCGSGNWRRRDSGHPEVPSAAGRGGRDGGRRLGGSVPPPIVPTNIAYYFF